MGIYEFILVDDDIRELAQRSASAVEFRHCARKKGYPSLREDGIRLVREGITTPEEVLRVTESEEN